MPAEETNREITPKKEESRIGAGFRVSSARARAWSEDHGSTAYASSTPSRSSLCVPPSVPVRRHSLLVPPPITMFAFADSCLCLALPRAICAEFEGQSDRCNDKASSQAPLLQDILKEKEKEEEKKRNDRSHLHAA